MAKYIMTSQTNRFCSSFVKSQPTWLRPEELKFEANVYPLYIYIYIYIYIYTHTHIYNYVVPFSTISIKGYLITTVIKIGFYIYTVVIRCPFILIVLNGTT